MEFLTGSRQIMLHSKFVILLFAISICILSYCAATMCMFSILYTLLWGKWQLLVLISIFKNGFYFDKKPSMAEHIVGTWSNKYTYRKIKRNSIAID